MKVLQENLSDERSLQFLATLVCMTIAERIYMLINSYGTEGWYGTNFRWGSEYVYIHLGKVFRSEHYEKAKSGIEYFNDSVYEFTVYNDMVISLNPGSSNKTGFYSGSRIVIYIHPETFAEKVLKPFEKGEIKNYKDIYFGLFYFIYSTVLHELRHAYDDYRTDGMVFKDKQSQAFYSDQQSGKHEILKQAEYLADEKLKQEVQKIQLQYLNLDHEVWARYSQALANISFVNMEFDEDFKLPESMKPLGEVINNFRLEMKHFHVLSDKMKKRLYRAISNAWHDAKDYLEKHGTYLNPHNKQLHEMNTTLDSAELRAEIEIRMRPDEDFLSYRDILEISQMFDMDEEDVAQAVSDYATERRQENIEDTRRDLKEYIEELVEEGVRIDLESDDKIAKMFINHWDSYHIDDLGVDYETIKKMVHELTKDPNQLALFERVSSIIRKVLSEIMLKPGLNS